MAKWTKEQIAQAAEEACFYVTPEGLWLRMQYTSIDEGYFYALDEDSGEEYRIEFDDMLEVEDPHFEHLVKTIPAGENPVKAAYEGGVCPDCGTKIPYHVADGDECENCEHVFWASSEPD